MFLKMSVVRYVKQDVEYLTKNVVIDVRCWLKHIWIVPKQDNITRSSTSESQTTQLMVTYKFQKSTAMILYYICWTVMAIGVIGIGGVDPLEERLKKVEETLEVILATLSTMAESGKPQIEHNDVIAFHAYDISLPIAPGSPMIFPSVDVNLGDGYNSETGEFTVPSGGAGVYFFYFYTLVEDGLFTDFCVDSVGVSQICRAIGDLDILGYDQPTATCGAVYAVNEGKVFRF